MEIHDIKSKLPLSEILQHYNLKPDKNNRLCCPFHDDKTPSMQVYPETNTFCCFSSNCKAGTGDQIQLIQLMEKCSKHEALKKATSFIQPQTPVKPMDAEQLTKTALLTKIYSYFKNGLKSSPPGKEYCISRNLNPDQLEIGYNSGQYHHRENKYLVESCLKYGLLKPNPAGGFYVWGKHCIVFPLKNKEHQIVSLYARSTLESQNKEDSDKRHFYLKDREGLYPGYPKANTKKLILIESIIDTATLLPIQELEQYSILALYGTNGLTAEHTEAVSQLKELDEIVFCLNADDAGRAATEKHSKTLKEFLPQIIISEIKLPEGEDINSLLQGHQKEIFTELLSKREFIFSIEKKIETPETLSLPLLQHGNKLDTRNPEQIHYNTNEILITLLGGISLQNLDRLRVTVYMRRNPHVNASYSIRQNIDLYQDEAVEKLIRRAAEKLELSTSLISKGIAEMTEELEAYRLTQIEHKKTKAPKRKELTEAEKQTARNYLAAPKLMQRTLEDLGKTGMVGEEINRLIMYLVMTSRKRETPINIISLGSSGIGKTHLQEKVSECIPEEDKLEITVMSENAFYYFGQEELKHKLLLIEDLDGAEAVLYPLRELQSKKRLGKTVTVKDSKGNMKTISVVVEGPVSTAGCTTREHIYEDNASRSFMIYIDESKEQDSKVMDYQRQLSAGTVNREKEMEQQESFKNQQRILRQIKVRNPFAPKLCIPDSIFKPRRTNAHYLQFIEAITFYHQYQRVLKTDSNTGEKYIETTLEDIEWANKLMAEILLRKADELTGAARNFLERLKTYLQSHNQQSFYAKEIRGNLRMNPSNLKRYLIELSRNGYVKITGGNKARGFEYEVKDYKEYENLKQNITTVLDEMLDQIKGERFSGSVVVHSVNGPLKIATVKERNAVVQ